MEQILVLIATPWGFPAELGNKPQMYLHEHYQMFKFLTWRQVDGVDLLVKSLAIAISL